MVSAAAPGGMPHCAGSPTPEAAASNFGARMRTGFFLHLPASRGKNRKDSCKTRQRKKPLSVPFFKDPGSRSPKAPKDWWGHGSQGNWDGSASLSLGTDYEESKRKTKCPNKDPSIFNSSIAHHHGQCNPQAMLPWAELAEPGI